MSIKAIAAKLLLSTFFNKRRSGSKTPGYTTGCIQSID
jgi:hypothetical protein